MKKILSFVGAFWRKLKESSKPPAPPPHRIPCVHCITPFTPEPDWKRTVITRPNPNPEDRHPNITYLDLCATCTLKLSIGEIKFVALAIGRGCSIRYIWEDTAGERYERYEYGKGPIREKTMEEGEYNPE